MREILFRGKRVDDGKWVYGYCYELEKDRMMISSCIRCEAYAVNPETIGQFTRLTDKNGKKIFEGDVVKCIDDYTGEYDEEFLGAVKFLNGSFCFVWNNGYIEPLFSVNDDDDIIVVDNVHDNPELIKEK